MYFSRRVAVISERRRVLAGNVKTTVDNGFSDKPSDVRAGLSSPHVRTVTRDYSTV